MPKRKHVLARLRDHLNATQSQFAAWCGCSPVTIQSVEVGRLALSKKLAERIHLVTGAPTDWLLENKLDSPLPSLVRPKSEGSAVVNARTARRFVWKTTELALRMTESIDVNALPLFYHYMGEHYSTLMKAFEHRRVKTDSEEARMSYIQEQITAFLNPSEEEMEKQKEVDAYLKVHYDVGPLRFPITLDEFKEFNLRVKKERERSEAQSSPSSGAVPKPAEKKPRQPRQARRRTPESA